MKKLFSPWTILVLIATIWRVIFMYWTPVLQRYVTPPGDDAAAHIGYITNLLNGHLALTTGSYPMGFHLLMVLIIKLTHWDTVQAVIWVTPILMILPVVVIYYVGKRLFASPVAGAVAAFAWTTMTLAPIRAYGDGNYPNLLASSILLPLAVLALYLFLQKPTRKRAVWTVIALVSVAFVHHLSTAYLLMVILPWLAIVGGTKLWRNKRRRWLMIGASSLGIFLLCVVAWLLFGHVINQLWSLWQKDHTLATFFGSASQSISWTDLLDIHNSPFVYAGLYGLLMLIFSHQDRSIKILMTGWIGIMMLFSLDPAFGLPGRFARELAIPLSLTIGVMAASIYQFAEIHHHRIRATIFIFIALGFAWLYTLGRPYNLPDPFHNLIRTPHGSDAAYALLDQITPAGQIIASSNSNPFLPYLVKNKVIIIQSPAKVAEVLNNPGVGSVIVGAQPPFTPGDVYTFYAGISEVSGAIEKAPNVKLFKKLSDGTQIFTVSH